MSNNLNADERAWLESYSLKKRTKSQRKGDLTASEKSWLERYSKKREKKSRRKRRKRKKKTRKTKVSFFRSNPKDEYYTPEYAFRMLEPYIQHMRGKTVWEPFGYNFHFIRSPIYIRRMGFKVIANGRDFWRQNKGEWVLSNPPYQNIPGKGNTKERIIRRLCELRKPFCLLLQSSYIQTKSFSGLVEKFGKFQVIMPSGKIQFYTIQTETGRRITPGMCSFYTCWVCWNMELVSDFIVANK